MKTRLAPGISIVVGLLAAWIGWGLYVLSRTERVPFDTLDRDGTFELRRYPATVQVETTAEDERTAFRRLFRYIDGENVANDELAMTAPVATTGGVPRAATPVRSPPPNSESVAMTTPVRTDRVGGAVTMAFFLPPEYTATSAPTPTNPAVHLVVEPARTVAVHRFSWYATDDRVDRARRALRDAIVERGLEPREEPVVLQYNDPWTPPFMRRNEVAVTVER